MTQISGSLPQPVAPDYDRTLVLAIELSNKSWALAAQVAGLARVKARQTIEPTAEALLVAIQGYRERATVAGRHVERVIATYEAGWSGFWLGRWLAVHEIETYVVQPSSVLVDRRARRAKSDGIDAELLLRTLLAWLRGEPRVCSMVPIPIRANLRWPELASLQAAPPGGFSEAAAKPYQRGPRVQPGPGENGMEQDLSRPGPATPQRLRRGRRFTLPRGENRRSRWRDRRSARRQSDAPATRFAPEPDRPSAVRPARPGSSTV